MPRCYMVKKTLCNKYANSVARNSGWSAKKGASRSSSPIISGFEPLIFKPGEKTPDKFDETRKTKESHEDRTTVVVEEKQLPSPPRLPTPPPAVLPTEDNNAKNPENPVSDVDENPDQSIANEKVAPEETASSAAGCVDVENEDTTREATTEITKMQMSTKFAVPESRDDINVNNKDNKSENDNKVKDAREGVKAREESALGAETRRSAFTRLNKSSNGRNTRPQDAEEVVGYLSSIDKISKPESFKDSFAIRSAAETEAAHDLLELSRSLPPLAPPSVAVGPQNVIEYQEVPTYQANEPRVYQLNTIEIPGTTNLFRPHAQHATPIQQAVTNIIYEPTTIIHQPPAGVFIPLSPVPELLFAYTSNGLPTATVFTQQTPVIQPQPIQHAQLHQEHSYPSQPTPILIQQTTESLHQTTHPVALIETVQPLTPPTSECSSDVENNNPNTQPNSHDKEVQTGAEPASYTFDTLMITDGRSKNRKVTNPPNRTTATSSPSIEVQDQPETSKTGRYSCLECGKQYATSSNLSRHKQTHRSIDSLSAKKCIHCGKAYVSMPALAMHVLTHKLAHSCGVCGKMFSRPWLLQGHLRSHTGEKPYGCAHCGKAFADRSNLRAHMQTHSSDKNYECQKCHKNFALKSYLNKHLESACQRDVGEVNKNGGGEEAS